MKRFLGGLLVAIGVLLAGMTGLCTGVTILWSPKLIASPLLLIGIIPCAAGVFIARAGFAMIRWSRRTDSDTAA